MAFNLTKRAAFQNAQPRPAYIFLTLSLGLFLSVSQGLAGELAQCWRTSTERRRTSELMTLEQRVPGAEALKSQDSVAVHVSHATCGGKMKRKDGKNAV